MEATYRCLGCGQRFGTRDGYVMTPITTSDDGIEWMLEGPTGELRRCVEVTHDNEVVFQSDADPSPLACHARALAEPPPRRSSRAGDAARTMH